MQKRTAWTVALAATLVLAATRAWAVGEVVTDIRVQDNARTHEDTIRAIAGLEIGDVLELDTLERVRERLNTSGLFADVNVFWEPYREGVRVNIVIKDKFPWAAVPTFSYSPGNVSAGAVLAHGNLFGRGKRGAIGGRLSNVDTGALVGYEDPAVLGSWVFFNLRGKFQELVIPEYSNNQVDFPDMPAVPMRETKFRSYGGEVNLGVAWWRRVKTSFGWNLEQYHQRWSNPNDENPFAPLDLPLAAEDAVRGIALGNITFDFRAREHAVMYGNALALSLDYGSPQWGSDEKIRYWKASASYEHGLRFFRKHNLILRVGGVTGERLPMWSENSAGGANLRGFIYRQFAGDTHVRSQVEYHFPLFAVMKLEVRGLVFNDATAIYYRKLPPIVDGVYARRRDGRQFLPPEFLQQGFDRNRDVHTSVGAGLRFYLKSVAVPLVGVDFGYGFGEPTVRMVLVLGA